MPSSDRHPASPLPAAWLDRLRQYALLVRLHRPIGILLLMWPALWALWLAGEGSPPWPVVLIFVLVKAFTGNSPSRHLISCMHRTSGACSATKRAACSARRRTELTFQVQRRRRIGSL